MNKQSGAQRPESYLPLPAHVFYILLSLMDGERHGYKLLQELRLRFEGMAMVGTATLYRAIAKMIDDKFIIEAAERPDPALDDTRRTYYKITDLGRAVAAAEARRFAVLAQESQAKGLINGSQAASDILIEDSNHSNHSNHSVIHDLKESRRQNEDHLPRRGIRRHRLKPK